LAQVWYLVLTRGPVCLAGHLGLTEEELAVPARDVEEVECSMQEGDGVAQHAAMEDLG